MKMDDISQGNFHPVPCAGQEAIPVLFLSQLFRGFTKRNQGGHENLTMSGYWPMPLTKAVETAYKAVMKPKEGTILTVARGTSEKAAGAGRRGG